MAQQTRSTVVDVPVGAESMGIAGIGWRGRTGHQVGALGYEYGYATGYADASALIDATPPVLSVTYPTTIREPLVVNLYDTTGLRSYEVTIGFHDSKRYVAYNDLEGFFHPYAYRSTVSGVGTLADPKIITIYPSGPWPTNAQIDVKAKVIDSGGNLVAN